MAYHCSFSEPGGQDGMSFIRQRAFISKQGRVDSTEGSMSQTFGSTATARAAP
jgi:hypothetical protein